jgi:hypothetical protein
MTIIVIIVPMMPKGRAIRFLACSHARQVSINTIARVVAAVRQDVCRLSYGHSDAARSPAVFALNAAESRIVLLLALWRKPRARRAGR